MKIRHFEWDSWNVEHITRHGVEPDEVEEMVQRFYLVRKGRSGLYTVCGQSYAGRYLFAVCKYLGDAWAYVITARDMTNTEQRYYRRSL